MAVEITLADNVYAAVADDHGFGEFSDAFEIIMPTSLSEASASEL